MENVTRHTGFVMAEDNGVFKVRVADGPFAGQKLRIVSTRNNCQLAVRLKVDFMIGMSQGNTEAFPVAIDAEPVAARIMCDRGGCDCPADVALEVSDSKQGSAEYVRSCLSHVLVTIEDANGKYIRIAGLHDKNFVWQNLQGIYPKNG